MVLRVVQERASHNDGRDESHLRLRRRAGPPERAMEEMGESSRLTQTGRHDEECRDGHEARVAEAGKCRLAAQHAGDEQRRQSSQQNQVRREPSDGEKHKDGEDDGCGDPGFSCHGTPRVPCRAAPQHTACGDESRTRCVASRMHRSARDPGGECRDKKRQFERVDRSSTFEATSSA